MKKHLKVMSARSNGSSWIIRLGFLHVPKNYIKISFELLNLRKNSLQERNTGSVIVLRKYITVRYHTISYVQFTKASF